MAGYQRFVSYIYEYNRGRKSRNTGFAKIESRGGICKLQIHLQGVPEEEGTLEINAFVREGDWLKGIPLGRVRAREPLTETRIITPSEHVGNVDYALENLSGLWISSERGGTYLSIWDDEPVELDKLVMQIPEEKTGEEEIREDNRGNSGVMEPKEEVNPKESPGTGLENSGNGGELEEIQIEETASQEKEVEKGEITSRKADAQKEETESRETDAQKEETESRKTDAQKGETESRKTDAHKGEIDAQKGETASQEADAQRGNMTSQEADAAKEEAVLQEMEVVQEEAKKSDTEKIEKSASMSQSETNEEKATLSESKNTAEQPMISEEKKTQEEVPYEQGMSQSEKALQEETAEGEGNFGEEGAEPPEKKAHAQEAAACPMNGNVCPRCRRPIATMDQRWQCFSRRYSHVQPFGGEEVVDCVRVSPRDLGTLYQSQWPMGRNSFLMHGYYNYRHLLFGKCRDGSYFLGIPGIYENQERMMADMFGFPLFREAKEQRQLRGRFGYWCRKLEA